MAKPIFLVGLPINTPTENIEKSQKNLGEFLDEYYTIVYITNSDDIKFECFFEKDFDDVKFEELKQIVKDRLNIV